MIREFTDLDAWKAGHSLVLAIYNITDTFPKKELFGLCSQLERAAVSVTSNIADLEDIHTKKSADFIT